MSSKFAGNRVIPFILLICFLVPVDSEGKEADITIFAVGDMMLSRHIEKVMSSKGNDYPFKQVCSTLKKGDIVFGNLESILSDKDTPPFFKDKPYNFSAPTAASKSLRNAGFNVLNLANNHAMDFGQSAISETRSSLYREGISIFGAGEDINEACKPSIITVKGLRFAFLGFGVAHSSLVYADLQRGGIAPIRLDYIKKGIQTALSRADVVIVSVHWGKEYDSFPSETQKKIAHQLVDWGADMVLGHHPHVLQGIEMYKNRPIAYSLGNFIFDQRGNGTDESIILVCNYRGKEISSVQIVPLDRFGSYFPRVAEGKAKQDILERLRKISLPLNTDPQALKSIWAQHERKIVRR